MSRETIADLNTNTLIGYTSKRGTAWHYRADEQGSEPNHYVGAIPVADVRRRLFNWAPVQAPVTVTVEGPNGPRTITDTTRTAIVRPDTGTILGVHSTSYRVHDYDGWLIDNVESILDADLQIGSAGLLSGGAVAWVQVEMEDTLSVEGVEYRPFLTAATSLDGSIATTYQTGAQVVVCDNTLSVALGERANRIRVRHSSKSLGRLSDVRAALNIVHSAADDFAAEVQALTSQRVSEGRWEAFVDAFTTPVTSATTTKGVQAARTRAANKASTLHELWNVDERVSPWRGTAYGVVAAVNTYTHHYASVRGATRATRNADRMVRGEFNTLDRSTLALLSQV